MIVEINSEKLAVKINTLGAELVSAVGNDGYEYIYQTTPLWLGQAKNLFPAIGQTKDNYILVNGEKYKAQQHGFAKDCEFIVINKTANKAVFELVDNEFTHEFLPYSFSFIITFEVIDDTITQSFTVVNKNDYEMYFGIGSHTGFIALEGSYLDFGSNCNLTEICRKDMMFLTGKCQQYRVPNGIKELEKDSYNHGADILTGFNHNKMVLKNHNHKHVAEVDFTSFQYLGMWTPADSQIAVSIMPWCGLPDAEDTTHNFEEKQGNVRLNANDTFTCSQNIKLYIAE